MCVFERLADSQQAWFRVCIGSLLASRVDDKEDLSQWVKGTQRTNSRNVPRQACALLDVEKVHECVAVAHTQITIGEDTSRNVLASDNP